MDVLYNEVYYVYSYECIYIYAYILSIYTGIYYMMHRQIYIQYWLHFQPEETAAATAAAKTATSTAAAAAAVKKQQQQQQQQECVFVCDCRYRGFDPIVDPDS